MGLLVRRQQGLPRLVVAAMASVGLVAAVTPAHGATGGLVEVDRHQLSPRLLELTMRTPAFARDTKVRVLLPTGYSREHRHYPVLYLLNGGAGSYLDWTVQGDAERITTGVPLIVVMPDGGTGGNYTDWYGEDGSGRRPLWETYHIEQLLPWVDQHFRTTRARAVAGMSMGGNGALHYAARHPDLFSAVASFSGAVDTLDPAMTPITETTGCADGALPGAVFGPRATQEIRWRGSNPIDLAPDLANTWISLATGNGAAGGPDGGGQDGLEKVIHDENVHLHKDLLALHIAHRWVDYGPGGHVWFYWKRELRNVLPSLVRVLQQPRPVPQRVSHWAVEPAYQVWGWSVHLTRPVLEASELVNATAKGFTLRGTGTATVTTPAFYPHPVTVRITDARGARTVTVRPGRDHRIQVTLDLGAPNQVQEYTIPTQSLGTAVHQARVAVS
jgi:S-formylglutathione hydrolase FrmB